MIDQSPVTYKEGTIPRQRDSFTMPQTTWGIMTTHVRFLRSIKTHDRPNMKGVGECSRDKELPPIKIEKEEKIRKNDKKWWEILPI